MSTLVTQFRKKAFPWTPKKKSLLHTRISFANQNISCRYLRGKMQLIIECNEVWTWMICVDYVCIIKCTRNTEEGKSQWERGPRGTTEDLLPQLLLLLVVNKIFFDQMLFTWAVVFPTASPKQSSVFLRFIGSVLKSNFKNRFFGFSPIFILSQSVYDTCIILLSFPLTHVREDST